ncbi:Protein kinase [Mortierella sp. GBA35]|nr:Protein kinase [Mortierella sp. GBA35]
MPNDSASNRNDIDAQTNRPNSLARPPHPPHPPHPPDRVHRSQLLRHDRANSDSVIHAYASTANGQQYPATPDGIFLQSTLTTIIKGIFSRNQNDERGPGYSRTYVDEEYGESCGNYGWVDKVKDEDGKRYALKTFKMNEEGVTQMRDLSDLLFARGSLSVPEVRKLGSQLIAGVSHLHKLMLLHCDLKPSNLLLTNKMELQVADVGLAEDFSTGAIFTNHGLYVPEVVQEKRHTSALDVWSIGVVLYEMLEGSLPDLTIWDTVKKKKDVTQDTKMSDELARDPFFKNGWCPDELTWDIFHKAPTGPAVKINRNKAVRDILGSRTADFENKKAGDIGEKKKAVYIKAKTKSPPTKAPVKKVKIDRKRTIKDILTSRATSIEEKLAKKRAGSPEMTSVTKLQAK